MALRAACHNHQPGTARARALAGAAPARRDVVSRACFSARRSAFAGPSDPLRAPRVVSRSRASSSRGHPTRAALGGIRLLKFDPKRCSVFFLDTDRARAAPNRERRYTLTHNDLTRHLTMSVAPDFNGGQTDVWVTRVLRDEVLAEWREDGLHVHCFVSVDGHWWLKWAKGLRALVFRQKLPLVLETLRYAERELLEAKPDLRDAPVFVHFHEGYADGAGSRAEDAASGALGGVYRRLGMSEGVREHWGPLCDAGCREGADQRVPETVGGGSFSRARDLWCAAGSAGADDAAAAAGAGASVGAMIEGALAGGASGGGAAAANSDAIVSRSR